ncbi:hypothetical protein P7K49_007324, partial [Saguinus oedipus]
LNPGSFASDFCGAVRVSFSPGSFVWRLAWEEPGRGAELAGCAEKVLSPGRPEEEGIRPVDGKARSSRRVEGGGRRAEGGGPRGGTGGVTRRPAGRNLRDLRVAVAVAAALLGRALGGGPGPRGRARGEPDPGWGGLPRGNRSRGRGGGGGQGGAGPSGRGSGVDLCPLQTVWQEKRFAVDFHSLLPLLLSSSRGHTLVHANYSLFPFHSLPSVPGARSDALPRIPLFSPRSPLPGRP